MDRAVSRADLDEIAGRFLSKNSVIRAATRELKSLSAEERSSLGRPLMEAEKRISTEIAARRAEIDDQELRERLVQERVDVTLPGAGPTLGGRHPLTVVEELAVEALRCFGFTRVEGPEVETAFHNFDALNIPEHHPARALQDTFWLTNGLLLRSHTTTVQARILEAGPQYPVKVVSAGRVYRNEAVDSTHTAMFNQLEGFWLEEGITLANLKGILSHLTAELFGDRRIRFKPKYYPYTEPSIGLDLACTNCDGAGCAACRGVGWVTIIGAGMIHPQILKRFGVPDGVTGLAFGWGTTRMAAQWAGLDRVKDLYDPSQRLLRQMRGLS